MSVMPPFTECLTDDSFLPVSGLSDPPRHRVPSLPSSPPSGSLSVAVGYRILLYRLCTGSFGIQRIGAYRRLQLRDEEDEQDHRDILVYSRRSRLYE